MSSINSGDEDLDEDQGEEQGNWESEQPNDPTDSEAENEDDGSEAIDENDDGPVIHWQIWDRLVNLASDNGRLSYCQLCHQTMMIAHEY